MWNSIYPELVKHALELINDPSPDIQTSAVYISAMLQKLVGNVIEAGESLGVVVSVIMEYLRKDLVITMDETMDWLILLMKEQPHSLQNISQDILKRTINLLPELEGSVNITK
jgi:hypothetical protein